MFVLFVWLTFPTDIFPFPVQTANYIKLAKLLRQTKKLLIYGIGSSAFFFQASVDIFIITEAKLKIF